MTANVPTGLYPQLGLTDSDFQEIKQLADICNEHDQIDLKLNFDMLQKRSVAETNDFLYYVDEQLVGYLGIYQFKNSEAEVSGMVHPNYRRRGIFAEIVRAAEEELRQRNVPKMIFILQRNSASGRAFLEHLGAVYSFSEYWMRMIETKLPPTRDPIKLREATIDDLETIAHMHATAFNMDAAEYLASLKKRVASENRARYMVLLNQEAIGTIAVNTEDDGSAFIYGFSIVETLRGRGYGRQALSLTIQKALAAGCTKIELEVACENINALSLYESCGFSVISANDYHVIML